MSASGPLDLEVLAQLRALAGQHGGSLADDAIEAFLKELPTRLRGLRDALDQSDWRTAEHGAQALRGISTTLGAREVVRLSGELADALGRGETSEAGALLQKLEEAGTVAKAALERERTPAP
jgi:HPt (histidine-containing phosphotransfer) domain-containing protein